MLDETMLYSKCSKNYEHGYQDWKSQNACQNSIANREVKQSDLGMHCLSRTFWQTTSIRNFRTYSE